MSEKSFFECLIVRFLGECRSLSNEEYMLRVDTVGGNTARRAANVFMNYAISVLGIVSPGFYAWITYVVGGLIISEPSGAREVMALLAGILYLLFLASLVYDGRGDGYYTVLSMQNSGSFLLALLSTPIVLSIIGGILGAYFADAGGEALVAFLSFLAGFLLPKTVQEEMWAYSRVYYTEHYVFVQ